MHDIRRIVAPSLAAVAALATVQAQETMRLPSIELLGSMRTISTTWPVGALSPDGTWLAYAHEGTSCRAART
jgi:hypothetical protein